MAESIAVPITGSDAAISIYQGAHSTLVLIIAAPGRGKSTSIRTLPPNETHIINVAGKDLPFPGGVKYIEGENLSTLVEGPQIREQLRKLSTDETINYIVVDDLHYSMASEFMSKAMVKGYDKFTIMARNVFDILVQASQCRPGLKIFILTHEEETPTQRKMKTLGKLLDQNITPEGLAAIVLWGEVAVKENGPNEHYFATQTDGMQNAKSPMDMFPDKIPNDLKMVADRIDEYYAGIELSKSKCLPR
jgi:hypothetical protein